MKKPNTDYFFRNFVDLRMDIILLNLALEFLTCMPYWQFISPTALVHFCVDSSPFV
uniref:Uncharacterized protein n=1 Tax=Arundo donax TaxID=35708 RepID=A0A0A9HU22_ARUDO